MEIKIRAVIIRITKSSVWRTTAAKWLNSQTVPLNMASVDWKWVELASSINTKEGGQLPSHPSQNTLPQGFFRPLTPPHPLCRRQLRIRKRPWACGEKHLCGERKPGWILLQLASTSKKCVFKMSHETLWIQASLKKFCTALITMADIFQKYLFVLGSQLETPSAWISEMLIPHCSHWYQVELQVLSTSKNQVHGLSSWAPKTGGTQKE